MEFDGSFAERLRNLPNDMVFEICKRVDDGEATGWSYNTTTKTLTVELGRLLFASESDRDGQIKAMLLLVNVGLVETLLLRRYIERTFSSTRYGGQYFAWDDHVDLDDFRDVIEVLDRRLVKTALVDSTLKYLDENLFT